MAALIEHGNPHHSDGGISHMMDREARLRAREAMGELAYKNVERWLDCYVVLSLDRTCVVTVARRLRKWRR